MLKSKNVEKLEEWIEKASNLKIRKIDKFVNGLKKICKRLEMLLYMNKTMDQQKVL